MSFKAIESPDKEDDKKWLTYWIVFGFFTLFDTPLSYALYFLPFYYPVKLLFYVWMFYPNTNGALWLYNNIIVKMLRKYQPIIDEKLDQLLNSPYLAGVKKNWRSWYIVYVTNDFFRWDEGGILRGFKINFGKNIERFGDKFWEEFWGFLRRIMIYDNSFLCISCKNKIYLY